MNSNNFLISYSNLYDITSFYDKYIYIDSINIIDDKYKKIIILKKIDIDNLFFYYIFDANTTIAILCKNNIINTIYLKNIILIITYNEIIKINIKYKTYIYIDILDNIDINIINIEKIVEFDNNKSEIIPEIYDIENLDDIDIKNNIENIKLKKYKNNKIIHCCLNYEKNIILQFKLFESYIEIIKNNKYTKIQFDNLIYDIYILNKKHFIIQFKNSYSLLDSNFKLLHKYDIYNDIILYIKNNIIN